jgi:hypothetical protein
MTLPKWMPLFAGEGLLKHDRKQLIDEYTVDLAGDPRALGSFGAGP